MAKYSEARLAGALNDPCPVCCLVPVKAVNYNRPGQDAEPDEGAVAICFGCGLVSRIHDGMRCALTDREANWLFSTQAVVQHVLSVAKLRSKQPMRVQELVREQKEDGIS